MTKQLNGEKNSSEKSGINLAKNTVLLCILVQCFFVGCEQRNHKQQPSNQQTVSSNRYISNPQSVAPSSLAVQAGPLLFISGQISEDLETMEFINGSIEQQTRQSLDNVMLLLRKAGYDSSHVIQTTVYLKDINDLPKMNLIYGGYFGEQTYPARTVVAVTNLRKNALIEISAVAYKPEIK